MINYKKSEFKIGDSVFVTYINHSRFPHGGEVVTIGPKYVHVQYCSSKIRFDKLTGQSHPEHRPVCQLWISRDAYNDHIRCITYRRKLTTHIARLSDGPIIELYEQLIAPSSNDGCK